MRLPKNSENLKNAIDLYCEEQRTSRFSIWNKYLEYFVNGNRFNFYSSDSTAFFYIFKLLYLIPYAVFALILLTVTFPVLSTFFNMARCSTLPDRRAIFFTLFEDRIRRVFRSQTAETMSAIVTGVSHILRPTPERPSILLFLATSDGKDTCARISRETAFVVISSFQKPCHDIDKVTLDCSNYITSDEFWTFYEDMTERMSRHKVVVLVDFEKINPQVATALCHLADDTYSPFPQSIVIVSLDIGNRFTCENLNRLAPVTLAETFLEEKWDNCLDPTTMGEVFGRLTGRAALIEKEVTLRRLTGSLPSVKGYSGPSPKLRRRRRTARSEMGI